MSTRSASSSGKPHFPLFSLFVLYAMSVVLGLDSSLMGALVTPIKESLHFTDEQMGRLSFAFSIASVALCPLFGAIGDRYARKPFMLVGIVVWSLATIGSGFSSTFALLLFWRVFVGLGEGVYQSLWPSFVSDLFGPRWRNVAYGIMGSTGATGWCIGFLSAGIIAAVYGWHKAFFLGGVPGLVLAAIALVLSEPRRGALDGQVVVEVPKWHAGLTLFRRTDFVLYMLGAIAFMTGLGIMGSWGAAYLHRTYGLTNRQATSFFAFAWIFFQVPGAYLGGLLGSLLKRRFASAYTIQMGICQALAATFMFSALFFHNLTVTEYSVRGEFFCLGLTWSALSTFGMEVVPVALRSSAVSLRLLIGTALGGFFSSEVVGLISDHKGLNFGLIIVGPTIVGLGSLIWWTLTIRHFRRVGRQSHELGLASAAIVNIQPAVSA